MKMSDKIYACVVPVTKFIKGYPEITVDEIINEQIKNEFNEFIAKNNYDITKSYEKTVACHDFIIHYDNKKGILSIFVKILNERLNDGKPRIHATNNILHISEMYIGSPDAGKIWTKQEFTEKLNSVFKPILPETPLTLYKITPKDISNLRYRP